MELLRRPAATTGYTQPPHIGFFLFGYPLGVSETILQSISSLAKSGCQVDVYIDEVAFSQSPATFPEANINVIVIPLEPAPPPPLGSKNEADKRFSILMRNNHRFPRYPHFLSRLFQCINAKPYRLAAGVEPMGLGAAFLVHQNTGCPMVYYNMELFQFSNCQCGKERQLKLLEIAISRRCAFTIIPDRSRAKTFAKENGIDMSAVRYLPISTAGPPLRDKGNYFREKFAIAPDRKIILYAGHITAWSQCLEIAQGLVSWDEKYAMVFHTWQRDVESQPYFKRVLEAAAGRAYFSTTPIERENFPQAISSADAGLMFYQAIDENFTEIGSSSNKLAQYLRAGLPVVASNFPSIRNIFTRFGCGLTAPAPQRISQTLDTVFMEYETYRKKAFAAYTAHYEFHHQFAPLREEFMALIGSMLPGNPLLRK